MKRRLPVFGLLVALFLALVGPGLAYAQDDQQEPPLADRLNDLFAEFVVTPIATVLFADVLFWDNHLPAGTGVGNYVEIDGERWLIESYDDDQGYTYRRVATAKVNEVLPKMEWPVKKRLGQVEFQITPDRGEYYGIASRQVLDVDALGIELDIEAEEPLRVMYGIAPVAVVFDIQTGDVVGLLPDVEGGTEVRLSEEVDDESIRRRAKLDRGLFPLAAGMEVSWQGKSATVSTVEADDLTLLTVDKHVDDSPRANPNQVAFPFVVLWLVLGAVFFTLRMAFINVRGFVHAIRCTAGEYDDPNDPGEISHFQALASALSATVGLGNIAGVAIAIAAGGPGAVVWMVFAALLGMSAKFTECTLGQMYREVRTDGTVSGGPMHYLDKGLEEMGLGVLGKVLAVLFAVMCIGGSLGGGNMFQANQSFGAVAEVLPAMEDKSWIFGFCLAFLVGIVIIGGIKRIGRATSIIVPVMCGVYVLAGVWILGVHAADVPDAFRTMLTQAFTADGVQGGVLGVLVQGFRRASFSNEAGIGSASIAHSAASTSEPVREGIVALLEPFIDTVIVCTMTGLVVVVTGVYATGDAQGVVMTSRAFETVISWFPMVLTTAVVLFAFSTMISWSYYGEKCATWLLGDNAKLPYRILFLVCIVLGSVFNLGSVLDFSDLMVLGMAFPNILGCVILSGKVKRALDDYWRRHKKGEFETARAS